MAVQITSSDESPIRVASKLIRQGSAVVCSTTLANSIAQNLADLAARNMWQNELPVVQFPNPDSKTKSDAVIIGTMACSETEAYLVKAGELDSELVVQAHKRASLSGAVLTYIYASAKFVSDKGDDPIAYLREENAKTEKGIEIAKLPADIKHLDLTTREGLLRAIQIQQAEENLRNAKKYAKKYYSKDIVTLNAEIKKAEEAYQEHLQDPDRIQSAHIVRAILERDSKTLVNAFINGIYTASEKVFGKATGVPIVRLSKANKEKAINDWASA